MRQIASIKPRISKIEGDTVYFSDGTKMEADALVHATGYNFDLPFLDCEAAGICCKTEPYARISLYKHIFPTSVDNLAFVGFVSINNMEGSLHRIIETQSRWVAGVFKGDYKLPDRKEMELEVSGWEKSLEETYNPMKVNNNAYIEHIRSLMKEEKHA